MLEPRWRKDWLERKTLLFIGGTAKFDLWQDGVTLRLDAPYVRYVYGPKGGEWDHFPADVIPTLTPITKSFANQQDLDEAHTYLRLFAPYLFREHPNSIK